MAVSKEVKPRKPDDRQDIQRIRRRAEEYRAYCEKRLEEISAEESTLDDDIAEMEERIAACDEFLNAGPIGALRDGDVEAVYDEEEEEEEEDEPAALPGRNFPSDD